MFNPAERGETPLRIRTDSEIPQRGDLNENLQPGNKNYCEINQLYFLQ